MTLYDLGNDTSVVYRVYVEYMFPQSSACSHENQYKTRHNKVETLFAVTVVDYTNPVLAESAMREVIENYEAS